jgi:hypothetical protein
MTTDEKLDLILKKWDELEIRLKNLETIINEIRNPPVTVSAKEYNGIEKRITSRQIV